MKQRIISLLILLAVPSLAAQTHFQYMRPVSVADPAKSQAYIVVDETILTHMQPTMGDVRLYSDGGREVPYVLRTQRAAHFSAWKSVRVLNKGMVGNDTQFIVDSDVVEYDAIELDLSTKDFVAKATVEGADDAAAKTWNKLGTFSLYDFSKEKLGSNKILRLKTPVRYRFLRITIAGGVAAEEVTGANIANFQEDKAQYVPLSAQARITQQGNRTIISWNTSEKVPVERIVVEVDAADVNFSRDATLFCEDRPVSHNDLSRVRLSRKGRQIESESLNIEPYTSGCKTYKLDIFNGDNPPLHIIAVKPMMLERRLYFEPKNESGFKLYYGDEKAAAPIYDYAKFFELADADKVLAADVKAEVKNPTFTKRPDDRPFTERYPAVLWIAMLVAVGLLGAWALKGFKS